MRTLLGMLVAVSLLGGTPASGQTSCTSDAACADNTVCNGIERCVRGLCQAGTPLQCGDTNPCTLDACDPVFGCQRGPVVNGTSCTDGNPCNGNEVCRNAVCQPSTPPADGASCNAGNPCTNNDTCQGGACVPGTPRPNGAGCGDDNPCNGKETCQEGVCTPGLSQADGTACGDGEPCNGADICQGGTCVKGPVPAEGASCSDGFVCNGPETCRSGVCTAGIRPPDGASCSDGKACNGTETCVTGICRNTPIDCDDGNLCTTDSCSNAAGGCQHTLRPDGARCGDGNPCNGQETCQTGACTAGTPLPDGELCQDSNVCNGVESCRNKVCVPGTPRPDGSFCADSDVCNGLETCQGGACRPGTDLQCSDGNPCTADSCNATAGCRYSAVPDGAACGDRDACNGTESCRQGLCAPGTPLTCGTLACDPFAGCVVDALITGRKLLLSDRGGATGLRVHTLQQISTSTPRSTGTGADPVLHGGVLRLRSTAGGFDLRFELPKEGWRYLGDPANSRGFRYTTPTRGVAIRGVVVRDGRVTKIVGGGPALTASLANDPAPVEVSLILGNRRYCMGFGGTIRFDPGRRYLALDAPAPGACPP